MTLTLQTVKEKHEMIQKCYQCNSEINTNTDIHFNRNEGLQCRNCHIIKVFGSLMNFTHMYNGEIWNEQKQIWEIRN